MIINFHAILTSTGYFSNSTISFVTNCQFSRSLAQIAHLNGHTAKSLQIQERLGCRYRKIAMDCHEQSGHLQL